MENEKRLIDANALISYMDECSKESRFRVYYGYAASFINAAPTVDAVPVVRCRDCKHYERIPNSSRPMCTKFLGLTIPNAYDFCSYGERKEGAN